MTLYSLRDEHRDAALLNMQELREKLGARHAKENVDRRLRPSNTPKDGLVQRIAKRLGLSDESI